MKFLKECIPIKVRIIGPCGSGKSYIAKALSKKYEIDYYELDNLVWDRSADNLRYPVEVRDAKLFEILNKESWIVEGAHYKWGQESFKKADIIFIINPNKYIRDLRVIRRFIKTRIGIEQWNYKQSLKNLYQMIFVWNRGYDNDGINQIIQLTNEYSHKRIFIKNNEDILKYTQQRLLAIQKSKDIT